MAAPVKLVTVRGFLLKLEGSYNAGGSLSNSTDGLLLEENAQMALSYANDGARAAPPGTIGYQRRVKPTGLVGDVPVKVAPKGAGAAYSSSVVPNIHNLLRICGFDAAGSFGAGVEQWAYTPTPGPTGYASGVATAYERGQSYPLQGILGELTQWSWKAGEVPVFEAALKGLAALPSDASVPTITYPALSIDAPKALNLSLGFMGVSSANFVVKSAALKMPRNITPRLDANAAGGHGGFAPGRRTPMLDVEIETPSLGVAGFFVAWDSAQNNNWSIGPVGSVQYNRYTIIGGNAQIAAPPVEGNDGSVATVKLSLALFPSALNANDEITWTFN